MKGRVGRWSRLVVAFSLGCSMCEPKGEETGSETENPRDTQETGEPEEVPAAWLEQADAMVDGSANVRLCYDLHGDGVSECLMYEDGLIHQIVVPVAGIRDLSEAREVTYSGGGSKLGILGDQTGDGRPELALPVTYEVDFPGQGSIQMWPVQDSGEITLGEPDVLIVGVESQYISGQYWQQLIFDTAADLNADGTEDLLVATPFANRGAERYGAAYVLSGPLTISGSLEMATAKVEPGFSGRGAFGYQIHGAGDTNGDGYGDFLFVYSDDDEDDLQVGETRFFFGPVSGELTTEDADAAFLTYVEESWASSGTYSSGDMNADGFSDVVIGAPYALSDSQGVAWVLPGPFSGIIEEGEAVRLRGPVVYPMGVSLDFVDDVDQDGFGDLLIGVDELRCEDGYQCGGAGLFFGPFDDPTVERDADLLFLGRAHDRAGERTVGAGDTNGDGIPDLAVTISPVEGGAATLFVHGGAALRTRYEDTTDPEVPWSMSGPLGW